MIAHRTVNAAVACFGLVFGAGFTLGTVRTLLLAPRTSETVAVANAE